MRCMVLKEQCCWMKTRQDDGLALRLSGVTITTGSCVLLFQCQHQYSRPTSRAGIPSNEACFMAASKWPAHTAQLAQRTVVGWRIWTRHGSKQLKLQQSSVWCLHFCLSNWSKQCSAESWMICSNFFPRCSCYEDKCWRTYFFTMAFSVKGASEFTEVTGLA